MPCHAVGGAPAPLRIGSHNVRGLLGQQADESARLVALLRCWARQRLDVVCVQETHVPAADVPRATVMVDLACRRLRLGRWHAWWGPAASRRSGGVAIFVRSALLASGAASVAAELPAVAPDAAARLLLLPLSWGGHVLSLGSLYLPSSDPPAQRAFIATHLTAAAAVPGLPVWAGDYNFVRDRARDSSARAPTSRASDIATSRGFDAALPGLADAYRHLHPTRRSFSFVHASGASRIDRLHLSTALLPCLRSCSHVPGAPSDHRLLVAVVAAAPGALAPGPGVPRVAMDFTDFADLRRALRQWAHTLLATAPVAPAELLRWWPRFEKALAVSVIRLNRVAKARHLVAAADAVAAHQQAESALAAVEAGDSAAAPAAIAARSAAAAAEVAAAHPVARAARVDWLRTREHASPAITRLVRPSTGAAVIPALRRPDGRLCDHPRALPHVMAAFWQHISTAAAADPAARARVLAALRASARQCPAELADALGDPEVRAEEVTAVLKASPKGRAPGADGLPTELLQELGGPMATALAAVFTAARTLSSCPRGFLDGLISSFPKPGDPFSANSYRPITLLRTSYRTLARVLTRRALPAFAAVIDDAQTAFLAGRRIADSILTLQLIPEALRAPPGRGGRAAPGGVVAFLDFFKAYDTLDRQFLLDCIDALGLGEGFQAWVRLLLTGTRSAAVVNGYVSSYLLLTAGVRQGCPLSPVLYLAPGQALLCWLDREGFGISWADIRLVASQYADDAGPLLSSFSSVPAFLAAMETYRAASGQRLNLNKVELLAVGASGAGRAGGGAAVAPGSQVEGLRVVASARTLGVHFFDLPAAEPAQPVPLERATASLRALAALPLSAFGRAFCSSAYALSRVLYHMEFAGLPRGRRVQALQDAAVALVDRRLAPDAAPATRRGRLPGLPGLCLVAPPSVGGFGLLSVAEHVRGRHAALGVRWIRAATGQLPGGYVPPWARLATALLRRVHPAAHPLCTLALPRDPAAPAPPATVLGRPVPSTCPALLRLLSAFSALPPVVAVRPIEAGPWCLRAPLWGNPALPAAAGLAAGGLEADFPDLVAVPQLATVGDVIRCWLPLAAVRRQLAGQPPGRVLSPRIARRCTNLYKATVWRPILGAPPLPDLPAALQSGPAAAACLDALRARIPSDWWEAAVAALHSPGGVAAAPPPEEAWRCIAGGLGWALGPAAVPVVALTVKVATSLQLAPAFVDLHVRHAAFWADAHAGGPGPPADWVATQRRTFRRLWALVWENRHKEAYWRLAVNGFAGFGMHAAQRGRGEATARCPCGVRMDAGDRIHHFWDCIIAQALRDELTEHAGVPILRTDLWLVRAPAPLAQPVWDVVCLAAVAALELGRQQLYASRAAERLAPRAAIGRVSVAVVADFWARLSSYARLRLPPRGWAQAVPAGHPFLAPGVGVPVVVVGPGGAAAPSPSVSQATPD